MMTLELSVSDAPNCGVTYDRNEGKSAASFCPQVAAMFQDMFCNFCLVKNHKIANNPTTTKAREKIKHRFGILRILEIFKCMFETKFKTIKFYLIKLATGFF